MNEKCNFLLQEAVRVFEDFTDQYLNITKSLKGKIGIMEDKIKRKSIFAVASAFENFVLKYGKYYLDGTKPSTNITSENMGSVIAVCVYKGLHDLLLRNKSIGDEKHYSSPDGFSGDGCRVVQTESNSEETVCSCNHLTHFAVLVDFSSGTELSTKDITILEIITYVGLSLSILGMLLTIALYFSLTDIKKPLSQMRISLALALGTGQIVFLAGIKASESMALCATMAVLMQYFMMAAFCWMLAEGIYLYLLVVKVYNIRVKMHMYHVISWGLPLVVVAISLSIAAWKDGIESYTSDEYYSPREWQKKGTELSSQLAPNPKFSVNRPDRITVISLGIKASVVMVPLLGVTWLFGLLSPLHKAFTYTFTILNSTQGFLIFLLHCVRDSQIRERFKRKVNTFFQSASNHGKSTRKKSQAEGKAELFAGVRQLINQALEACLAERYQGSIICEQQLADEHLKGLRFGAEPGNVEELAVCPYPNVYTVRAVLALEIAVGDAEAMVAAEFQQSLPILV
ncbi:Latrophilin-like protein LAT-2 [Stylophora pistillata]|uniref:Latrophilin-like protein LAT-2 n=1 Tax=Stylophora pistillata TaxID=50429 RepID=A0A2B4RM01_STYPI|nr:Latrophilin-like protein LAT-2 [Stylophora pistillata]